MPLLPTMGIMFAGMQSGHLYIQHPLAAIHLLSVNTYFTWCNISVLSRGTLMKFGTNIRRVSGHC